MTASDWAPPLVRPEDLERLTEHVHVIPDGSVPGVPNVGIVVGSRAVLIIDTGIGARNGRRVLDVVTSIAPGRPQRLMTTHVHPEHDLGAGAFPADTVMLRARSQVAEIAAEGLRVAADFRGRSSDYADLLEGAAFRDADIVFDDALELDLGGVHVRLRSMGANHTPGDTVAHVVEDAVLFSGDIAMSPPPAFASPRSSMRQWVRSLDVLEEMSARIIVPSHGPVGGDELIDGYRLYFRDVHRRASAARAAGRTVEEAVAEIIDALLPHYPDAGRIAGAVRVSCAEIQENTDDE
ncbi:MBL fold metallo-hydrolase [Microbacterium sp. LWH13-1.2]|uniref:MBL fold metallo-hydrolase n=1 Tax=Microbacterium sp. LWH13-1.2 TaxID=3135260 RepID=UPI00313A0792